VIFSKNHLFKLFVDVRKGDVVMTLEVINCFSDLLEGVWELEVCGDLEIRFKTAVLAVVEGDLGGMMVQG
jgi:hypothetical protein